MTAASPFSLEPDNSNETRAGSSGQGRLTGTPPVAIANTEQGREVALLLRMPPSEYGISEERIRQALPKLNECRHDKEAADAMLAWVTSNQYCSKEIALMLRDSNASVIQTQACAAVGNAVLTVASKDKDAAATVPDYAPLALNPASQASLEAAKKALDKLFIRQKNRLPNEKYQTFFASLVEYAGAIKSVALNVHLLRHFPGTPTDLLSIRTAIALALKAHPDKETQALALKLCYGSATKNFSLLKNSHEFGAKNLSALKALALSFSNKKLAANLTALGVIILSDLPTHRSVVQETIAKLKKSDGSYKCDQSLAALIAKI